MVMSMQSRTTFLKTPVALKAELCELNLNFLGFRTKLWVSKEFELKNRISLFYF
jgi:hypothetical protein